MYLLVWAFLSNNTKSFDGFLERHTDMHARTRANVRACTQATHTQARMPRCMGAWVLRCMGLEVRGCMGVGVCVPGCMRRMSVHFTDTGIRHWWHPTLVSCTMYDTDVCANKNALAKMTHGKTFRAPRQGLERSFRRWIAGQGLV